VPDDLAAIRRLYDRLAERYDRAQQGGCVRWILKDGRVRAAQHARGRLLEIGIGSGASLPFYSLEIEITGIDVSPGMLAHAQHRLEELGRSGDLRVMDAQKLEFANRSFDSVAFNLVLCTIPNPAQAIREALRVAKPGAPMTFLEHVRSNHWWVAAPQDVLNTITARYAHDRFNLETEKLIRRAGIEVVSSERWLAGAMTLIVGRAPLE
jgi:ubiquinone/menaquinone biosynthesis C-methylase UbiE